MQDWKIKQEIYHRLNPIFSDDLNTKPLVFSNDIVPDAVRYFKEKNVGWIYPAKSYMVAICYARWIAEEFPGEDKWNLLDDERLLFGNDPYFKPYSGAKHTYDRILKQVGWDFPMTGMVPDVRQYFEEEFML